MCGFWWVTVIYIYYLSWKESLSHFKLVPSNHGTFKQLFVFVFILCKQMKYKFGRSMFHFKIFCLYLLFCTQSQISNCRYISLRIRWWSSLIAVWTCWRLVRSWLTFKLPFTINKNVWVVFVYQYKYYSYIFILPIIKIIFLNIVLFI